MNVLYNTINKLNQHVNQVPQYILKQTEEQLSYKPRPEKWSKKEILGHLCDSAINNLGRFIRAQFENEPFVVNSYMQDDWVKANYYQEMTTADVVELWSILNKRIIHVASKLPEDKLAVEVDAGGAAYREIEGKKTLLWLIEDYLAHMEYHLNQIKD